MVVTPVGMKCRACGLQKGGTLFTVKPLRLVFAFVVAMAAGAVASFLGEIGFIFIFVGMAYGYFAGTLIMKAAGMKRGIRMEITAGAGMVIGALAVKLLPEISAGTDAFMALADPWYLIAVAIATACAVSKIRYL
jgi:hypothetical protein